MYKGTSLYAGHLSRCNTCNFWCTVSNIAQGAILIFMNIVSLTEALTIDDDLAFAIRILTSALKFITDAVVLFYLIRAARYLNQKYLQRTHNYASSKRWLWLIQSLIVLSMLETVLAIVGRLIPHYTRDIEDPRRSISL